MRRSATTLTPPGRSAASTATVEVHQRRPVTGQSGRPQPATDSLLRLGDEPVQLSDVDTPLPAQQLALRPGQQPGGAADRTALVIECLDQLAPALKLDLLGRQPGVQLGLAGLRAERGKGGDAGQRQIQRPQPSDQPAARDLVTVIAAVPGGGVDVGRRQQALLGVEAQCLGRQPGRGAEVAGEHEVHVGHAPSLDHAPGARTTVPRRAGTNVAPGQAGRRRRGRSGVQRWPHRPRSSRRNG